MSENIVEQEPLKWWERVKYVFINPDKAFENLANYPRVLFPIIVFSVGILLLLFLRLELYKEFLRDTMLNQFALQGAEVPENIDSIINIQIYVSMVSIAVMPLIVWVIKSGLINGVAGLFGGSGTFKEAFSVISHAYLPVLLGQIIIAIISMALGEFQIPMSFAILLPDSMAGGFLFNLLSQFDIFVIWYEILAIIGISKVYGLTTGKSSIIVLGTWASWILITTGIGTLTSALTGAM